MAKKPKYKLAVFDIETDPFLHNRVPKPFALGFYDGDIYKQFWAEYGEEDKLIMQFYNWLKTQKTNYRIYAHNGGKFDFFYLLWGGLLEDPLRVINSRIVSAKLRNHELRDSYAILPFALGNYQKDKISYDIFEEDKRHLPSHRAEIEKYLKNDCVYLYDLVKQFTAKFGTKLTVASSAMDQLKKKHTVTRRSAFFDDYMRKWYFGGRVECLTDDVTIADVNGRDNYKKFLVGLVKDKTDYYLIDEKIKSYDVNSMYPHAMRNFKHPCGDYVILKDKGDISKFIISERYSKNRKVWFAKVNIFQADFRYGVFPQRVKTGLSFPRKIEYEIYYICSHEYYAMQDLNLGFIGEYEELVYFKETCTFKEYVDHWVAEKVRSKKAGFDNKKQSWIKSEEHANYLFSKLMLNSAYGKFGQDPSKYKDYHIVGVHDDPPEGATLYSDYGQFAIWESDAPGEYYFDVAIAASITSAPRGILLKAIYNASNPFYCDTDSLLCTDINAETDSTKLGAWELEKEGDLLILIDKKLYALADRGKLIKSASKGVRLNELADFQALANGVEINYRNPAPTMSLANLTPKFVSRKIKNRRIKRYD